jgi:hypothetical protein
MTEVPADAQRSDDGQWWWDGTTWQPVAGAGDQAVPESSEQAEVTAEELVPVQDMETTPGDGAQLTERLQPYFWPNGDDVPDDESDAERDAVLNEDEFTGSAGG